MFPLVLSEKQANQRPEIAIFRPPYNRWNAVEILAYYQQRQHVRYFAVLDEEQASREKIEALLEHRFDFNGECHYRSPGFDWTHNPSHDREWLILLHKFYYAAGLGRRYQESGKERYLSRWLALTYSWIEQVSLDFLTSDVMGRRVQNWIFAHYYFVSQSRSPLISPTFYLKFLISLHEQVEHLCHHLTPARNHRTIELCAIFWAAVVFPELEAAGRWLNFARQELVKNLQTDSLADGVQVELSTDYHHLVLKNYLAVRQLAALNDVPLPAEMDTLLQRALTFALYAHKPDGFVPSFSDGDVRSFLYLLQQGYALYGSEAMRYVATAGKEGRPPDQRSHLFAESGYLISRSGWGEGSEAYADERYLILDCGPLGAGNHGHLDLLSFEMAAYGRSLIVDPGRYTYDESGETNWRALFRGTSYHNTVQVDQKEQTCYRFHKTRYRIQGPAPEREVAAWISQPAYDFIHAIARSHEYPVVHERKILFPWLEYWVISDLLTAAEPHQYDLRFHLAAEAWQRVEVTAKENTRLVYAPHLVLAQPCEAEVGLQVEPGYVSPTYGLKQPAPVVRFTRQAASTAFHTVLYPYRTKRPQLSVRPLPVWRDGRSCAPAEAFALSITITQEGQPYHDLYFHSPAADQGEFFSFANCRYDGSLLCLRWDNSGRLVNLQTQPESSFYLNGKLIGPR
jgi:hypothetical protein